MKRTARLSGQALVETALCLGVFLLLVCGALQLAAVAETQQRCAHAAAYAALAKTRAGGNPDAELEIEAKVRDGFFSSNAVVTIAFSSDGAADVAAVSSETPLFFEGFEAIRNIFSVADGDSSIAVSATSTNAP